jgi:hypothetical protein
MRQPVGVPKPEPAEVRKMERFVGKRRRDVAERVGTIVPKARGIRLGADAERIENEKNGTARICHGD